MTTPTLSIDEVRRKRLARLMGTTQPPDPSTPSPVVASPLVPPAPLASSIAESTDVSTPVGLIPPAPSLAVDSMDVSTPPYPIPIPTYTSQLLPAKKSGPSATPPVTWKKNKNDKWVRYPKRKRPPPTEECPICYETIKPTSRIDCPRGGHLAGCRKCFRKMKTSSTTHATMCSICRDDLHFFLPKNLLPQLSIIKKMPVVLSNGATVKRRGRMDIGPDFYDEMWHKKGLSNCVRWHEENEEYVDKVVVTAKKWCKKLGVELVPAFCGCCTKPAHLPDFVNDDK